MGVNAIVGLSCLGALWTAALLVAGAALQDLRALRALGERLRRLGDGELGVGLAVGDVIAGSGPDGALATHEVTQLGRALDAGAAPVAYRDTTHASRVLGGVVRAGGRLIAIGGEAARASVWVQGPARDAAARAGDPDFASAYAAACTSRGHARTLATTIRAGDRVFVAGELVRRSDELVLRAPAGGELLVATTDPRAFIARRRAALLAFVAGELAVCALCTLLAAWPPVFGRVSTAGAVLCLAFFLGVTPLGVWLRDRCAPPSRASLHA